MEEYGDRGEGGEGLKRRVGKRGMRNLTEWYEGERNILLKKERRTSTEGYGGKEEEEGK